MHLVVAVLKLVLLLNVRTASLEENPTIPVRLHSTFCSKILPLPIYSVFHYRPSTWLQKGNVFSRVCLSFCLQRAGGSLYRPPPTGPNPAPSSVQGPDPSPYLYRASPPYSKLFNLDLTTQAPPPSTPPPPTPRRNMVNVIQLGSHCNGSRARQDTASGWHSTEMH